MMTVWRRACLSQVTHASSEQQAGVRNFYFSASGQVVQSADVCKMQSALFYAIKQFFSSLANPGSLQHTSPLLHAYHSTKITISYWSTIGNPISTSAGKVGPCVQSGKKSGGSKEEMPHILETFWFFLTSSHWVHYFILDVRKSEVQM